MAGHHQIVVDLVRHQDQVVPAREIGHAAQFLRRPDLPAGVVRRAQDRHPRAFGQAS
jgi:hypothetical protein